MPKVAASERDAELVTRELYILLRAGAFSGSLRRLQAFIDSLKQPTSKFEGFENVNDLPLSLADLDLDVENALEDYGIRTVGQYREQSHQQIRRIPGIGPRRLKNLADAIEAMIDEFVDWVVEGTIKTTQPEPLPPELEHLAGEEEDLAVDDEEAYR